jgi:IS30 family transposase
LDASFSVLTAKKFLILRPKSCLLALNRKLRDIVASKLILNWSPEQISGWLKLQYPDDESLRVSHETIYRSLCS